MVKINRQIVSDNIIESRTSGAGNSMEFIAIHETANENLRADADAHARLQENGNRRKASWHYQVDDLEIIQSFEDNIRCWHVGNSNNKAIAIEICINRDGDFDKAVENAVALTKYLMDKHNVPLSKVKQHNYFTGKNCPTNLRNGSKGLKWNDFINMVKGSEVSKPKPAKPSKSTGKTITQMVDEVIAGKHGNGHANRQKSLGISNEDYALVRAEVNRRASLPKKAKPAPAKPKPAPKAKSVSQMAQEVIDGKHGNGHANRQKSLGVSNAQYAKVRAEVNKRSTGKSKPAPKLKSLSTIAAEVIAGKWGNNPTRATRLKNAGYNPSSVQGEVNKLLGSPSKPKLKSNRTIAREVIAGKWGNNPTRATRLKNAGYNPAEVQKEVNRLL